MTAPSNFVSVQGVTVNADQINTLAQWCPSVATLRGFIGTSNQTVLLLGTASLNDGGQGTFYWNPTSTAPDDGTNTIVPTGVTQGAWLRLTTSVAPIFPSSGTVSATCGGAYVALGNFTLTLKNSTSVSASCQMYVFAYAGVVTLALASGSDSINGGTAGVSVLIPKGFSCTINTDAGGHYYATIVQSEASNVIVAGGSVTAQSGNNYVATNAFTLDLPNSTTALSKNSYFTVFAYGGAVTLTPLSGTDKINGGSAGASLVISQNYFSYITTDGNGNFYSTNNLSIAGTIPSSIASFSANKNGSSQSQGSSPLQVTFGTAAFNIGGFYNTSTSTWTPPSGRVVITAMVNLVGAFQSQATYIYKNGSPLFGNTQTMPSSVSTFGNCIMISAIDQANGSDAYTVYVGADTTGNSINGSAEFTYFQGSSI